MSKDKKKRTKKHCELKRASNTAVYGTMDLLLVFIGGVRETHALNKKTGGHCAIGPTIVKALESVAFKWHVYLAVLCRSQTGEEYIQSEEMNFIHPYRRELISHELNDRHDKLIRTCNPAHVLNIGWIASTVPYEFDDKHCDKLFNIQNGWNYLAEWEKDKVIKEAPYQSRCLKCGRITSKSDYYEHGALGRPCKICRGAN